MRNCTMRGYKSLLVNQVTFSLSILDNEIAIYFIANNEIHFSGVHKENEVPPDSITALYA